MKISYKKLWIRLIEKDISPATLRKDLNIATGTMTKLRKKRGGGFIGTAPYLRVS